MDIDREAEVERLAQLELHERADELSAVIDRLEQELEATANLETTPRPSSG